MSDTETLTPSIFAYKITADVGTAPCVQDGLISLCICKPLMRKSRNLKPGDWIVGLGGKSSKDLRYRLIYLMKVAEHVDGRVYYAPGSKYERRYDCIYVWDDARSKFARKANTPYPGHSEEAYLENDLGRFPDYKRAVCLIGKEFAYFGSGKDKNPDIEPIKDIYESVRQGHWVFTKDHRPEMYETLMAYIQGVIDEFGYGEHGDSTFPSKHLKQGLKKGSDSTSTPTCGSQPSCKTKSRSRANGSARRC